MNLTNIQAEEITLGRNYSIDPSAIVIGSMVRMLGLVNTQ